MKNGVVQLYLKECVQEAGGRGRVLCESVVGNIVVRLLMSQMIAFSVALCDLAPEFVGERALPRLRLHSHLLKESFSVPLVGEVFKICRFPLRYPLQEEVAAGLEDSVEENQREATSAEDSTVLELTDTLQRRY